MRPIDAEPIEKALFRRADKALAKNPYANARVCAFRLALELVLDAPTIAAPPNDAPPNDPLTLEELREMDGEPVYVHWVRRDWQMGGEWAFVCLKWQGCKTANGGAVFFDRYGEWWLAYRRKPEEELL